MSEKKLAFEIRGVQLGTFGYGNYDDLSTCNTSYHFAVVNNPVNQDEKIFWMNTVTNWVFKSGKGITFGCMIFYFPTSYGLKNPTLEDFKLFVSDGINQINEVLKDKLKESRLPDFITLEPFQEKRDLPLLKNAFLSWSAVN